MAEMLIVVAIIAVLGGVGFIAVQNYQRSMAQLECDAIAKEIFVAAQNHLTMAESQGYLGLDSTSYGNEGTLSDDQDIFNRQQVYYFTVNGSSSFRDNPLLDMMLPFGSIDETVRLGGSYIIRYQPKMARVLDVFYTDPKGHYPYIFSDDEDEYKKVMGYRETNKTQRQRCADLSNATLGWSGGEDPLPSGDYSIEAPAIEVQNAERLTVTVTDKNYGKSGAVLKLIVTSKDAHTDPLVVNSGYAKAAFLLDPISHSERVSPSNDNGKYTIVLDDITTEGAHFAELNDITETTVDITGKFIPGEDIIIQAVAYNKDFLSNIAYSNSWTVNSLFAEISQKTPEQLYSNASVTPGADAPWITAIINNFRHLENLDAAISNTGLSDLAYAWQINDLVWNGTEGFTGKIQKATNVSAVSVYNADNTERSTDDCFAPVIPSVMNESLEPIAFTYDGREIKQINGNGAETETISHSITGLKVNTAGNAGLFGNYGLSEAGQSNIAYLELVDFEITSTGGNAGALAGTLNNTTVSNVLAYHNNDSATITATNGDAGGLVGNMTGGQIKQCAAALYVQGKANAGGLVGKAENAAITASYSGGHTKGGLYSNNTDTTAEVVADKGLVNVIGGTNAGGLVGYASNANINSCYSTCSASGTTAAGGLIGSVDNATGKTVTVNYCYAAGLVKSDAHAGTFLGQGTLKNDSNYYYFVSGINGTMESGCKATVLSAVVEADSSELCKPTNDKQKYAVPYDTAIIMKKGDSELHPRYTYLTIQQICEVSKPDSKDETIPDFISMHYGDWQEPVTLETGLALINAERLTAKVSLPVADLGAGQMLTMMVKGKTSEQSAYLVMSLDKNTTGGKTTYDVALKATSSIEDIDEITGWLDNIIVKTADIGTNMSFEFGINLDSITDEGCHFAQLFPTFIPGEDITIAIRGNEVTAFEMLAVIDAMDEDPLKKETNSLFADLPHKEGETDIDGTEVDKKKAAIGNFRHLENLDKTISGLGQNSDETKKVEITTAVQNGNLDWNRTWENGTNKWNEFTVYKMNATAESTDKKGLFLPVSPEYVLAYKGQGNAISNIVIEYAGHAGLFSSMVDRSSISNLELIDFSVTGTGDAGTLAGKLTNTEVINVISYHNSKATSSVTTTSGDAGGLIGSMSDGKVEKSAAAVIVSGGNAGGLIGAVSGGTIVSASYSGGHTENASYSSTAYNVTATDTAGGLIGVAGNANISNSYSTCSATGDTVGGFVGTAEGTIQNCYATGLVSGSTDTSTKGAFAGELSEATNCWVYEIINEGMDAVGSKPAEASISIDDIDKNTASYNKFVGNPDTWNPANPYDSTLETKFENKFNLRTVDQLANIDEKKCATGTDFVAKHYGDWPAPEMLVVNIDED